MAFPDEAQLASLRSSPPRPNLARCLEVVREDMTGEEAWAALHRVGLAIEDPQRRFLDVDDDNLRIASNGSPGPDLIPHPPTALACVAFASLDRERIVGAERLAVAHARVVDRWRSASDPASHRHQDSPISAWDLVSNFGPRAADLVLGCRRFRFALTLAEVAVRMHEPHLEQIQGGKRSATDRWAYWHWARELDLAVPSSSGPADHGLGRVRKTLAGKPFRAFEDVVAAPLEALRSGLGWTDAPYPRTMCGVRPSWAQLIAEAGSA